MRALPLYELWKRDGTTAPRMNIDPAGAPGAILDCRTRVGKRLSRTPGVAAVMSTPVVVSPSVALAAGHAITIALPLPKGRWSISLDYMSSENLDLSLPGVSTQLPAYLGRPGPYFNIANVAGRGVKRPVLVSLYEQDVYKRQFMVGWLAQRASRRHDRRARELARRRHRHRAAAVGDSTKLDQGSGRAALTTGALAAAEMCIRDRSSSGRFRT